MNEEFLVMIIGSGGREHSISHAYEKSPRVKKIIITPGNDFMAFNREKEIILEPNAKLNDAQSFLAIAQKHKPDLIDVAQDDALANGTIDLLQKNGFRAFGPTQNAARIEWDKKWSREFMQRNEIPIPKFKSFDNEEKANEYVKELYAQEPNKLLYIKATGLAAGKGALKTTYLGEALQNISMMKNFGSAGKTFLIEEGLVGEEFSYYAISDGKKYALFRGAQDHKTIHNFDEGAQTGGMGTISPVKILNGMEKTIEEMQIKRALEGMQREGNPYVGILYVGGIIASENVKTIEYNARWGDPEAQVILPGVKNDYFEMIWKCTEGKLDEVKLEQDEKVRVCVVGASKGYPGDYSLVKGKEILGMEEAMRMDNVHIFGAGIKIQNGKLFANGGRLFNVVGEGKNSMEARKNAYAAISLIRVQGNNLHYRNDIGWRDVERHQN